MDEEQQAVTEITSQRPQETILGACKQGERQRLKNQPLYQQQQKDRLEKQQTQLRQGRSKVPKFNPISHRPQLAQGDRSLVSTINIKALKDRHHQTHPGLAQDTTLTLVFDGDGPMYKFRLSSSSNLDCLMALLHYTRRVNAFGIRPLFVLGTKSSPMKEDEQNKRAKGRSEQGVKLLDRPSRALLEEAARVSTNDGSSIGFQVFFAAEGIEAERAALSIVKQGKENDETMIYALVANDADAVAMSGFLSHALDILCENYFTTTTDVTTTDATTNTDATTSETSETTTPITPTTTPTTPTTTTDANTTTPATKRVLEGRRVESNSKKLKKSKPPGTATAETETTTTTPPTTNNEPGGHRKRAKTSDIPTTPAAHATQPITTTPTSTTSTTTTTTTTTTSTPTPTHKRNLVFQRVNLDSFKEVIVALSLVRIIKTY